MFNLEKNFAKLVRVDSFLHKLRCTIAKPCFKEKVSTNQIIESKIAFSYDRSTTFPNCE